MVQVSTEQSLNTFDVDTVRKELMTGDEAEKTDVSSELMIQAASVVDNLLSVSPADLNQKNQAIAAVEQVGGKLQREAATRSDMLKQPIHSLAQAGEDGGPVADSLLQLRNTVESLDPNKFEFSSSFIRRLLCKLPFVGSPLARYFAMYQSSGRVIDDIVESLEKGREQLKRDNITLQKDQTAMHDLTVRLKKAISLAQAIADKLNEKLETEIPTDDPKHNFIKEEILFPLTQRIMDLQQQLAVNQQGILTIEVIIRNNKELIRGVNRAVSVTVQALQVAVTLALALENQRIVLKKVAAVNETTNNLIAGTAARLRQQGAEIHKQAASTQLNMETLKKAFDDVNAAIEDLSTFRQEALPKMAKTVLEMDQLNERAGKAIAKLQKGKAVEQEFGLEIVDVENGR
ncbi:toxic anion resistance protein [Zooshikella harenae]|uniref:Toxic anion resistance protein n=1 Tax=Zooshikella harenae TaxID=2827238 RepID=A0ABS5Z9C7_9GAMM|nr:toxic anion resistance protein [Zooshikella harenae]MBU2709482.1 toxic anion resistance protein [Zooshikella harenae]